MYVSRYLCKSVAVIIHRVSSVLMRSMQLRYISGRSVVFPACSTLYDELSFKEELLYLVNMNLPPSLEHICGLNRILTAILERPKY